MAFSAVPLAVVALSLAVSAVNEVLTYLLVFRSRGYQSLLENWRRQRDKADPAKDSKNAKRAEARLQTWRAEAQGAITKYNTMVGMITLVLMMGTIRYVPRFFGDAALGTLPFEPPSLVRKLTQRGLSEDAAASSRAFGALFVYILCQAISRAVVPKLLGLGAGRDWAELQAAGGGFLAAIEKKRQ